MLRRGMKMTGDLLQAQIGSHTLGGLARNKAPVSKPKDGGEDVAERVGIPLFALFRSFSLLVFKGFRWQGTLFAALKSSLSSCTAVLPERLPKQPLSSNKAPNKMLCTAPSFTSLH